MALIEEISPDVSFHCGQPHTTLQLSQTHACVLTENDHGDVLYLYVNNNILPDLLEALWRCHQHAHALSKAPYLGPERRRSRQRMVDDATVSLPST